MKPAQKARPDDKLAKVRREVRRAEELHAINLELRRTNKELKEKLRESRAQSRRISPRLNPHLKTGNQN